MIFSKFFSSWRLCAGLLAVFYAPLCLSNYVEEHSFEERKNAADCVVVGKIVDISQTECPEDYQCAHIEVLASLKGAVSKLVRVTVHTPVSELNKARCCEVGAVYLYFLRRDSSDSTLFYPINPPFGLYLLEEPEPQIDKPTS